MQPTLPLAWACGGSSRYAHAQASGGDSFEIWAGWRLPEHGTRRPAVDPHDTVTYHTLVELLAPGAVADLDWTPTYISPTKTLRALATNRAFRSTTWYLQFTFKPLRVIQVDLPNDKGRLQKKTVWY